MTTAEHIDYRAGCLLLVDKPLEWTSFDVVNKIKHKLNYKIPKGSRIKVGHAGTLDPLATGLLIVATGKFTKKLHDLQGLDKTYSGTIKLGATTASYDAETEEQEQFKTTHLTDEKIKSAVEKLTGTISQIPPIYSAIRIDGERAYKKARRNETDKLPDPRTVKVHSFETETESLPLVNFKINCSKGTYIRSLAFDLGRLLDNGGYLISLRRTSIGHYSIDNSQKLEDIVSQIEAFNHERLSKLG